MRKIEEASNNTVPTSTELANFLKKLLSRVNDLGFCRAQIGYYTKPHSHAKICALISQEVQFDVIIHYNNMTSNRLNNVLCEQKLHRNTIEVELVSKVHLINDEIVWDYVKQFLLRCYSQEQVVSYLLEYLQGATPKSSADVFKVKRPSPGDEYFEKANLLVLFSSPSFPEDIKVPVRTSCFRTFLRKQQVQVPDIPTLFIPEDGGNITTIAQSFITIADMYAQRNEVVHY